MEQAYDLRTLRSRARWRRVDAQHETIKLVNRTIREFADDPRINDDAEWDFFCECGCFTLVSMTLAEFDRAEAIWAPGHGEVVSI